jgi:CheY-like chemotaxis protein
MSATILIAEDYDDNRELLRLLLSAADYHVLEARNGQECLQMAREHRPDLVMVDLSMPGLDGWQVFKELKADPLTAKIPCVAVTALAHLDQKVALANGFSAFVPKPFQMAELLQTVAELVGKDKSHVDEVSAGS